MPAMVMFPAYPSERRVRAAVAPASPAPAMTMLSGVLALLDSPGQASGPRSKNDTPDFRRAGGHRQGNLGPHSAGQ